MSGDEGSFFTTILGACVLRVLQQYTNQPLCTRGLVRVGAYELGERLPSLCEPSLVVGELWALEERPPALELGETPMVDEFRGETWPWSAGGAGGAARAVDMVDGGE